MEKFSGLGDNPEDREWFWREAFPKLMRMGLGQGFKRYLLGSEDDNLGSMLLRLAENYMMAPQDVVPAFAEPIKITTPPDGMELPPQGLMPGEPMSFYTGITWRVPDNCAAVITSIHQELESPAAYADVGIRLFYRGKHVEFWNPRKPQVAPVKIVLFQQEVIEVQYENLGIIPHWLFAEMLGYWFLVPKPDRSQRGLTVNTQSQG